LLIEEIKQTWLYLSHAWGADCPSYGNGKKIEVSPVSCMGRGDSCNKVEIRATNHDGSHMDFPRHFSKRGAVVTDYEAAFFVFNAVSLAWFDSLPWGTLLAPQELERQLPFDADPNTELLLIRTGAGSHRSSDEYWRRGIGLGLGCADFLRVRFPKLRAIGLDTLSITSYEHRETGREVHREFLDHASPILILEDLTFEALQMHRTSQVIALPLRIAEADGAPCTVIASVKIP
jgi:kynurenine formamidase